MKVANTFAVQTENKVVKRISRSVILQSAVKPAEKSIRWYEDKKK